MRYLKMLGLAAVAVGAVAAFVGAGTASATVLCKTNLTTGCLGAWDWQAGTGIGAESEAKVGFITTMGIVENECEGSIAFSTGTTGSATTTVTANVAAAGITWKNCTKGAVTTTKGGTLEIHHKTGTDHGTVTLSGFEFSVTLFGIACIYKTGNGNDFALLTEGAPATIDVSSWVTSTTFGCPASLNIVGAYKLTTPTTTLGVSAS